MKTIPYGRQNIEQIDIDAVIAVLKSDWLTQGSMVDRFETSLDLLWYRSDNNNYPANEKPFDEHKDPVDALAEESLNMEVARTVRTREMGDVRPLKTGS